MTLTSLLAATANGGEEQATADHIPGTVPYAPSGTPPFNAPIPLDIPTTLSQGRTVHPSVVDFGVDNEWHGFRFWMGITEYGQEPGAPTAGLEDPYILCSHDGFNWAWPDGLTNPISTVPLQATYTVETAAAGVNSDTELVYDPDTDLLHLWWREYGGADDRLWHTSSSDGSTWATPDLVGVHYAKFGWISPCIVRMGADDWRMWSMGDAPASAPSYRTATSPEGPWTPPVAYDLPGRPWHAGIYHDAPSGIFYLLGSTGFALTSEQSTITGWTSHDGLTWTKGAPLLVEKHDGWDDNTLYRPCLQLAGDRSYFRVWYSAYSSVGWMTGFTTIPRAQFGMPS